jgi:DNA topoisomerase-2
MVTGVYTLEGQKLVVSELPVGVWTNTFKEHLEHLITTGIVQSYVNKSTDETVWFEIQLLKTDIPIEKTFKLQNTISLGNMHAYKDKVIHKFDSVAEILEYFYQQRMEKYVARKIHVLEQLKDKMDVLDEKIRFIELVLKYPEIVFRQTRKYIQTELEKREFKHIDSLIQMPIYSWSMEKIKELETEYSKLKKQYDIIDSKTETQLYIEDLEQLQSKW